MPSCWDAWPRSRPRPRLPLSPPSARLAWRRTADRDLHELIVESWAALKKLPEAAYLALTVPRFLLRNPYGKKTDPLDRFDFEEFTPQYGLSGMLWGNSAILAGLLLGQTFSRQGLKKMNIGSLLTVDDMPFYFYTDADGDQVALPCTERLINVRTAAAVSARGFIPVLSIRGRPEARLGGLSPWPARRWPGPGRLPRGRNPRRRQARRQAGEEPTEAAEEAGETPAGDEDLSAMLASLGSSEETPSRRIGKRGFRWRRRRAGRPAGQPGRVRGNAGGNVSGILGG